MEFQWTHDAVRRQYRSSTEPVPPQPPFVQIPPSLIPGNRHRQTFSATPAANRLLYSGHGIGTYPMPMVPAFPPVSNFPVNPSPYPDFQLPPPPPPPMAQAQSPVRPRQQQPVPVVPPLPPKTPISTSPSISPTVPPKPPPFVPPPPPTHTRPKLPSRSYTQPAPPPLPPPPPPSKPMGARSASYKVTSTSSHLLQPHVMPSAKPSAPAKRHMDTDATPPLTSLPVMSPAKGQLGMNEEEELKLVLELSAHTVREHANSLHSQKKYIHDSPPRPVQSTSQPNQFVMDSENIPSSSFMPPVNAHSHDSNPSPHTPSPLLAPPPVNAQLQNDEAFARRLQAEYENERTSPTTAKTHGTDPSPSAFPPLPRPVQPRSRPTQFVMDSENVPSSSFMPPVDAHSRDSNPSSHTPSPLLVPSPVDAQLQTDEAFARRLEAEYENERTSPTTAKTHSTDPSPSAFPPLLRPVQPRSQPNQFVMDSENLPSSSFMPPVDTHSYDSNPSSHTPSPLLAPSPVNAQLQTDEAFARRLEAEYENERTSPTTAKTHSTDPSPSAFPPLLRTVQPRSQPNQFVMDRENVPSSPVDAHSHDSNPSSHTPPPLRAPSPVDAQLQNDEAFARRLEAEYETERTSPTTAKTHSTDPSSSAFPQLPPYKETAVERPESDAVASPRVQQVSPTSTSANDLLSVPDLANTPSRNSPPPAQRSSPRPEVLETTGSSTEEERVLESASSSPQSSRPLVTPNEFVEPELLYGVSFGFNTPPMDNLEMRGSVPNIIALPYGKSPPMYIRAPSWRQLLKLMAKLSATRVEPSVEALSVTKGELQLRTVIQFFKLHQNSSDWRTVVYLTIDYPPPPDYRYTNMDVNVLPYSYSLSTIPTLLRNGPDSNICKYYTIPATARTPFPKLPISMPSLAMYLTAALEDSRRALSDSSSSLRRLAKMVDQFYPNQASQREAGDEEGRRRGGRTFIGRLIGRSPRPPQGGRNADVYDLVTPFVPDEWG